MASLIVSVGARSGSAANIAFLSFHSGDNAPSAGAAGVGFTTAPDKGYTDLLTANGHTVTRFTSADNFDVTPLNAFDLVIVSRSVASGHYQQANETLAFNTTLTKPMILLSGYIIRNVRLGYTAGGTIPDAGGAGNPTGVVRLQATNPAHPIFAGVSLDGTNTMANPYNTALPTLFGNTQRGISVNTDAVAGGGTVLASINTAGDGAQGGMIIGHWAAGSVMNNAAPANTLGGPRLVFLTGTREANAVSSETAGVFDLDADGQRMFLNAVNFMTIPEPTTSALGLVALGALRSLRRRIR